MRIVKHDGTKVFTQQLFWNSTTKRIYSNVDTKIVTADDTHYTEGFESDEDLVELNFRHWKGKVMMKEEMMQQGGDSTVVDKKSEEPQVEPKATQSIKRDTKRTNTTIRRTQPKSPTSLNRFDKTTDRLE